MRRQKEYQRLLERIQHSLLSQQMKKAQEAALKHAALDPETADMTEAKRLARHKQSERYQAYQSRMAEWHAEQERKHKEIEFLATADLTEEERLARLKQSGQYQARQARLQAWEREQAYQPYRQGERAEAPKTPTPTPTLTGTPTSVKPPVPPPTPPMLQGTPTPTATPTTPVKSPQPDQLPPSPVPACTMPPTPQVFIGPAPTKQPTPTPVPPLTGQDIARGICEAADLVDPVMPDPATVGGPDVGDWIDQAYMWQQSVPRISPEFETVVRTPIMIVKAFKDGPSTIVNFICQQKDKSGPYYEMFPIDQKVQGIKDWWNGMNTKQKVFVVGFTLTVSWVG